MFSEIFWCSCNREVFRWCDKHWECFVVRGVSEWNWFWFQELGDFETGSNSFYHVPCLPVRWLWRFDDLLHAHRQFGNILCIALWMMIGCWFRGTSFRSHLQGDLKGLGRGEAWTKVWRSKGASPSESFKGEKRRLQGGFKRASKGFTLKGALRGLEGSFKGLKPSALKGRCKGAWRGLHLQKAWRGLEGGFIFRRLEGGFKGASRGLEAFKGAWSLQRWRGLRGCFEGGLKGVSRGRYIRGLGTCKICTQAIHSEACWTRVTSEVWACGKYVPKQSMPKHFEHFQQGGLKEAWRGASPSRRLERGLKPSAHRAWRRLEGFSPWSPPSALKASSPLQAPFKVKPPWSPRLKPPWSSLQASFKPPWSPLQRWRLQARFKAPWNPLEAPFKPHWSPLQAPLKPPSSPLEASSSLLEAFRRWSPLQAFVKGTFKACFAEGEAPFVAEGCPSWRSPEPSWTRHSFRIEFPCLNAPLHSWSFALYSLARGSQELKNKQVMLEVAHTQRLKDSHPSWLVRVRVSSKRFAGDVIWSVLWGFNRNLFCVLCFCMVAERWKGSVYHYRRPWWCIHLVKVLESSKKVPVVTWKLVWLVRQQAHVKGNRELVWK